MKLPTTLFAMLAAGVLLIAACGGDDSGEPSAVDAAALTLDDRAYLDKVEQAFRGSDANFEKFNAALARSFASPEAILSALVEAGAGTTFDPVLESLKEIEPTERFVEEHRIIVEGVARLVEADQGIGAAAADGDIAGFELGNHDRGSPVLVAPLRQGLLCHTGVAGQQEGRGSQEHQPLRTKSH